MGTRKSERFENHMDVSVPETQGDATIQEEFFEETSDLFEDRLSNLDKLKEIELSKFDNDLDLVDKSDKMNLEPKNDIQTPSIKRMINAHLGRYEEQNKINYNFDNNGKEMSADQHDLDINIDGAFDAVPDDRKETVYDLFKKSPDEVKNVVNMLKDKLSVEKVIDDDSYYDLLDKKIKMEENIDDSEYAEIFSHEYGHFVDNQFNDISNSEQFVASIKNDLKKYDSNTKDGLSNLNDLIDNLVKSDVAFDMAISDNMSALFKNDLKLMERYSKEGIAYYGHDNDYWNISGNCEAEIFANNFSMLAQGNNESCEFMKKYFLIHGKNLMKCLRRCNMNSIEFGKKCRPMNVKYREIFGYVPYYKNYKCSQQEYYDALVKAVETKQEITNFISKKNLIYNDSNKKY